MEWLKKHWEILAAIAVGIPVLYWLYQTYQSDSAANAQAAQSTALQNQEQTDEAAYAQQVALANLGSGSSGGSSQGNIITTPSTVDSITSTPDTNTTTPVSQNLTPNSGGSLYTQDPGLGFSA